MAVARDTRQPERWLELPRPLRRATPVPFVPRAGSGRSAFLHPSQRGTWPCSIPSKVQPGKTRNYSKVLLVAVKSGSVQSQQKRRAGQMARLSPGPPHAGSPSAGWEVGQRSSLPGRRAAAWCRPCGSRLHGGNLSLWH